MASPEKQRKTDNKWEYIIKDMDLTGPRGYSWKTGTSGDDSYMLGPTT